MTRSETKTQTIRRSLDVPRLCVLAGIVAAAALGSYQLGRRGFWFDEAFSYSVARLSGSRFLHSATSGDPSQTLYYFALHLWLRLGDSETAIRSLSVIFATATVPMIYLVGKQLFDRRIAATAAVLLPLNSFFIEQAQEARGYSLVMLGVTTSTFFYIRGAKGGRAGDWIAYGITSALAVLTHAFALFVLAGHAVSALFFGAESSRRKHLFLVVGGAIGMGIVIAVPVIKLALGRDRWSWIGIAGGPEVADQIGDLVGQQGPLLLLYLFLVCVTVAAFIQSLVGQREGESSWRYSLAIGWFFIPIVSSLLLSFAIPMFVPRYLSVTIPGLVLLVSAGAWHLERPKIIAGALSFVTIASTISLLSWYQTPPFYKDPPWREVTAFVLSNAQEGDTVLFDGSASAIPFFYYKMTHDPRLRLSFPFLPPSADDGPSVNLAGRALELLQEEAPPRRLWLVTSYGQALPQIRRWVDATYVASDIGLTLGIYRARLFVPPA